jgi:hypothetical protein
MKILAFAAAAAVTATAALLLSGCVSPPPGAERGPHGTIAYYIQVQASPPGAHIEVNGWAAGDAPVRLKLFGDLSGRFHDYGPSYFVVRALPVATNQFVQMRLFRAGPAFGVKDRIPEKIEFDMNQPTPYGPTLPGPPAYVYPYPPPVYYYPPPPYYYGPGATGTIGRTDEAVKPSFFVLPPPPSPRLPPNPVLPRLPRRSFRAKAGSRSNPLALDYQLRMTDCRSPITGHPLLS